MREVFRVIFGSQDVPLLHGTNVPLRVILHLTFIICRTYVVYPPVEEYCHNPGLTLSAMMPAGPSDLASGHLYSLLAVHLRQAWRASLRDTLNTHDVTVALICPSDCYLLRCLHLLALERLGELKECVPAEVPFCQGKDMPLLRREVRLNHLPQFTQCRYPGIISERDSLKPREVLRTSSCSSSDRWISSGTRSRSLA